MKKIAEKILLITDVPPCKSMSGAIMTLQQVKSLLDEKHKVDMFLVVDDNVKASTDSSIAGGMKIKKFSKPAEFFEDDKCSKEYYEKIDELKKELHSFIKENNYTKIWIIIQGEVILELADYCRKNEKIDYICQIWDDIDWWIKENKFSEERTNKVLKQYKDVIKNAYSCITLSDNMSKYLSSKVKGNYVQVMPAIEVPEITDDDILKDNNRIDISMAGQVYAKEELNNFFSALDKINWEIDGKEVYFHHYGSYADINIKAHKKYKKRLIREGFISQKNLIKRLASSDFLYCPYFFSQDEVYKKIATTSFPSKLITYLAVPTPVIVHAPDYSSPYEFVKKYNCGYLITSDDPDEIVKSLSNLSLKNNNKIIENAKKAFNNNFTLEIGKKNFFKALNIKVQNDKRIKILEVNNVDLPGRRFNGYNIMEVVNEDTDNICNQIVTYKTSDNYNVSKYYDNDDELNVEYGLIAAEQEILSVHNVLSLTSNILKNHSLFKEADVVHYHLVHNTKLSMCQLDELVSLKPAVISLHDPWWFTGRCVHPENCQHWKNGCGKCEKLDDLFPMSRDNSGGLWNLKESVYKNLDAEIIVTSPFMNNMIKDCKMTDFQNVHLIPFGIDLEAFKAKVSQKEARKKLGISSDSDIVLFLRAQRCFKGTEYVDEALKLLDTDKKISVITCSEKHLLDDLKDKYEIIDLGNIEDDVMKLAYTACDIFLMPSLGESFGLMAVEAMASSKPIVVFNNSALPYVTHAPECGVLVENKNSEKLMEAIKMLIDDKEERDRRGKLGRKICEKEYDEKEYNRRILEVYEKAIERQKNKKVIKYNLDVDYSKKDVMYLINDLEKVYKRLGFITKLEECELFNHEYMECEDKNHKINYGDEDVKKVIIIFNNFVYSVFEDEIASNSGNIPLVKLKFFKRVINKCREVLTKYPKVYKVFQKLYRGFRTCVRKIRYRKRNG